MCPKNSFERSDGGSVNTAPGSEHFAEPWLPRVSGQSHLLRTGGDHEHHRASIHWLTFHANAPLSSAISNSSGVMH